MNDSPFCYEGAFFWVNSGRETPEHVKGNSPSEEGCPFLFQ